MEKIVKKEVKYLILGGGVTGLSFANFIKNDYLILEKENEAGGFCRTIYKKDYVWDYAGHFFHFSNEKMKEFFMKDITEQDIVVKKKNTKIFFDDNFIDYPFQKNIHQLSKDKFINCLYDLFNKEEKENYNNFLEMLYGKFGKSITEYFLKPYNEKLYACNLNDLDVNSMGRFFPYADVREIINNMKLENNSSYNDVFLYPKKGAIFFINKLLEKLDKNKILLNEEITKIDIENKMVFTKNYKIKYKYLINTIPLDNFCYYINFKLKEIKKIMTYNKVLVFNLGFDKKSKYEDLHWLYIPDKSINFYRIGFYDNILNQDKLSMYIEIGFNQDDEINIEKELNDTVKNLKRIGIIDSHILCDYEAIIMKPAYVHISEKSNNLKEKIKEELKIKDIYSIGRYGDWKYCSIEDSILDSLKLADKLKNIGGKISNE